MHDLCRISFFLDRPPDYFRQSDRPMPPAGAPQRDRQIAFSFLNVVRNQVQQQAFDSAQELARLRKGTDVTCHARILSAEGAQARHKVRVRKEAHVEHEVRIRWNAVAESEAYYRDKQRAPPRVLKAVDDGLAQFVHVEFRGVDDDICQPAYGSHASALFAYSFSDGLTASERMGAPRFAETTH